MNKLAGFMCAIASAACLGLGLVAMGQRALLGGGLALAIWLCAYKWPAGWLSAAALLLSVAAAAGGMAAGAAPLWMLLSATLALASWDLARLAHDLAGSLPSPAVRLLEQRHYASLALALGSGLLIAAVGRALRFQLSFWVIFMLVIALLYSLDRVWRTMRK
jgi:hypothetical protein